MKNWGPNSSFLVEERLERVEPLLFPARRKIAAQCLDHLVKQRQRPPPFVDPIRCQPIHWLQPVAIFRLCVIERNETLPAAAFPGLGMLPLVDQEPLQRH